MKKEKNKDGTAFKKQFYAQCASKKDKGNIRAAAILGYICAGATLLLGVLMQNYFIIIDVAIILGLSLGIHLAQNRVCAVLLLIYSLINVIFSLLATGQISGWWLIIVGVCGIIGTFDLHKNYQNYLETFAAQPTMGIEE